MSRVLQLLLARMLSVAAVFSENAVARLCFACRRAVRGVLYARCVCAAVVDVCVAASLRTRAPSKAPARCPSCTMSHASAIAILHDDAVPSCRAARVRYESFFLFLCFSCFDMLFTLAEHARLLPHVIFAIVAASFFVFFRYGSVMIRIGMIADATFELSFSFSPSWIEPA